MTREPSLSMVIYILFLFVACINTLVELVRGWRVALPFRLSRQASNSAFLVMLETSANSLKQWIGCTLLGWGILTSLTVSDLCNRLLCDKKVGSFAIVSVIQDLSMALTMALAVALFSFLVGWHMLKRIEHLQRLPTNATTGD
jgi:hypothetical protein